MKEKTRALVGGFRGYEIQQRVLLLKWWARRSPGDFPVNEFLEAKQ